MSFERHEVQRYIESLMGCTDLLKWASYKVRLNSYQLTANDVAALHPMLVHDATALYIKSLQTFAQALASLKRGEFAWPIVKFYYAVFYAIRSEMHASSVMTVMNKGLYSTLNQPGQMFTPVKGQGSHQAYINLRNNLPITAIAHDKLLDNNIEVNDDVYTWMRKNRERVSYQMKRFSDPEPDDVLSKVYADYFEQQKLTDLFNLYKSDIIYCFDVDHATLAVPYKKLLICNDLLQGRVSLSDIEQIQMADAEALLLSVGIDRTLVDELML